jgi:hypothetical protein
MHFVTFMTYLIAAGSFMHIAAGGMDAFKGERVEG